MSVVVAGGDRATTTAGEWIVKTKREAVCLSVCLLGGEQQNNKCLQDTAVAVGDSARVGQWWVESGGQEWRGSRESVNLTMAREREVPGFWRSITNSPPPPCPAPRPAPHAPPSACLCPVQNSLPPDAITWTLQYQYRTRPKEQPTPTPTPTPLPSFSGKNMCKSHPAVVYAIDTP